MTLPLLRRQVNKYSSLKTQNYKKTVGKLCFYNFQLKTVSLCSLYARARADRVCSKYKKILEAKTVGI